MLVVVEYICCFRPYRIIQFIHLTFSFFSSKLTVIIFLSLYFKSYVKSKISQFEIDLVNYKFCVMFDDQRENIE